MKFLIVPGRTEQLPKGVTALPSMFSGCSFPRVFGFSHHNYSVNVKLNLVSFTNRTSVIGGLAEIAIV